MRLPSGGALHVSGPAGASPYLFLHGVAGGAWSWDPQVESLAPERRVYVWEGRGHGDAAEVADAGLGDYFVDANEALDAVLAEDCVPPVVVGHSMGGLLAMALAAERPTDVAALALLEPVYAPDDGAHLSGPLGRLALALIGPIVHSIQRDGRVSRTIARAMFKRSFEDGARMERAWPKQRTQVPLEYPKMMTEAFKGTTNFPNRAFAREIDQPVLLIEGSVARKEPRFPVLVKELADRLGDRYTYLRLDGGHYLQLDRSEPNVTAALAAWGARWSR